MTPVSRRIAVWLAYMYELEAERVCERHPYTADDDREAGSLYEAATRMSERALRGIPPDAQDAAWAAAMETWTPLPISRSPFPRTLEELRHGF